nr:hypothetical protein [Tanacetum cinerariifolium]
MSFASDKEVHLPSPAVKIMPSKGGGGRGVKEKNSVASCAMEKNEAVKDGVAPSVTVARGNTMGTQGTNSVKGVHNNIHDKNAVDETVMTKRQSPLMDTTGFGSYPPLPTQGTTPVGNTPGKSSYDNVIGESSKKAVNIRTLLTTEGSGIDVVVPVESIRAISERFVNTANGFFLGKRMAYPVVANYVRDTGGKFDLVKSMLNSSIGLLSFQFSSMDCLNSML